MIEIPPARIPEEPAAEIPLGGAPPSHFTMTNPANDPFELERFLTAHQGSYGQALAELKGGLKVSHWMWFVFPQFAGLGRSEIARFYAIQSAAEADAYLHHPVLGQRLVECCEALLAVEGRSAAEIFGFPDDVKLQSSVTLFATVAGLGSVFEQVLTKYFGGHADLRTLGLLEQED